MIRNVFYIVAILALLVRLGQGACADSTVSATATADTPLYVAALSGIRADDTLTLVFNWNTYGDENNVAYDSGTGLPALTGTFARYVDSANTGFVHQTDSSALCSSHVLAETLKSTPTSSVGYNTATLAYQVASCPADYTEQVEAWSTLKTDCGSDYFQSSTAVTGTYTVSFTYRITYIESLQGGDTRTVSNDYQFIVTAPTEFTVNPQEFQLAGITTQIIAQQVRVDKASGSVAVHVTTIGACGNTFVPAVTSTAFGDSRVHSSAVVRTKLFTTITAAGTTAGPIAVRDATAFPLSGSVLIVAADGSTIATVSYTRTTSTSLTVGTGGSTAATFVGNTVLLNAATTTTSSGVLVSASATSLTVASTTGFSSPSGRLAITVGTGASKKTYAASYASVTSNTFGGVVSLDGDFTTDGSSTATELDVYTTGTHSGLCANSWVLLVDLATGPCSLSGDVAVVYTIIPPGTTASFTSSATVSIESSDTCHIEEAGNTNTEWTKDDFHLILRTASAGAGSVIPATSLVTYGQTAHWDISAQRDDSNVPKPSSFVINQIERNINGAGYVPITLGSSALAYSIDSDLGVTLTSGISNAGTANEYDMYFSHVWDPVEFPPATGVTTPTVSIKVSLTLTYPAVGAVPRAASNGKRNFNFHTVRGTAMQTISPPFALSESRAATPDDTTSRSTNVALIAALAAVGAVLCVAAAVAIFVVVRRRRRGQAQKAAAAAASGTVYQQTADFL